MLLEEIRNLRVQLQRSIDANIALREKLEEQIGRSLNTSSKCYVIFLDCMGVKTLEKRLHIWFVRFVSLNGNSGALL